MLQEQFLRKFNDVEHLAEECSKVLVVNDSDKNDENKTTAGIYGSESCLTNLNSVKQKSEKVKNKNCIKCSSCTNLEAFGIFY